MQIDLTICGVDELREHEGKPWTHIVSIWDKAHLDDAVCRERVKAVAPRAEILFNFFDDTSDPNDPNAPRLEDVQRILDFARGLPRAARLLVHCRAGVSRSTATAYAILCQHTEPGREMENLLHVETLRDLVLPNRLILELADKVLGRNGGMLLHLHRD
jgi:predicted protein tyrosine phosphatase